MTTADELKGLIDDYGGESAVIGLGFDNSSGVTFTEGQFTYANNIDDAQNIIKFTHIDNRGVPYIVLKPIETVQSITVKDPSVPSINMYDRVSLRG